MSLRSSFFMGMPMAGLILVAAPAVAAPRGPSAGRIKSDLKSRTIRKVEIRKRGSGARRARFKTKSGRRVSGWIWEATVHAYHRTEWKGVTKIVRGDVEYWGAGGRWTFERFRHNSTWFEGLTPPTEQDIRAALDKVGYRHLLGHVWRKLTAVHAFKVDRAKPFEWKSPTEVFFDAVVEYSYKYGREIYRVSQRIPMGLSRESLKSPWTSMCEDLYQSTCLRGYRAGQEKVLAKSTPANLRAVPLYLTTDRHRYTELKGAAKVEADFKRTRLRPGDRVRARFRCGKTWSSGTVLHINGRNVFILFDDTYRESVDFRCARPMKPGEDRIRLRVGQRVKARWQCGSRWFKGRVKAIKAPKILVRYDDKTEEWITHTCAKRH